jgi:hypothetical protein
MTKAEKKKTGGMAQETEHLPHKLKALNTNTKYYLILNP